MCPKLQQIPSRSSGITAYPKTKLLAYKAAASDGKRVIITLEIPPGALTNIDRKSVAVPETAKYRANKAKVLKIEGEDGTPYTTAKTAFFVEKALTYTVGEVIDEPGYDPDPEQVCSSGIHFFLSKCVAELYGLEMIENGLYQVWQESGELLHEEYYAEGILQWGRSYAKDGKIIYDYVGNNRNKAPSILLSRIGC